MSEWIKLTLSDGKPVHIRGISAFHAQFYDECIEIPGDSLGRTVKITQSREGSRVYFTPGMGSDVRETCEEICALLGIKSDDGD